MVDLSTMDDRERRVVESLRLLCGKYGRVAEQVGWCDWSG
jgi:hypothetical protein